MDGQLKIIAKSFIKFVLSLGLLKDLVVLLRPVIYLPGDYVCRKDDIGKEMFILQSGTGTI
jgi:hypothetical protein